MTPLLRRTHALPGVPTLGELEGPSERLGEIARAIVRGVRRKPLWSVAVALAAGFVLGGALSSRAGRAVLSAGGRHVLRELLKQVL
jgi:hypothetical protein